MAAMMSRRYEPQVGTVAAQTIQYLQSLEPGAEVGNREICIALGRQIDGISTLLSPAVSAHFLQKRLVRDGRAAPFLMWSLGSASAGYKQSPDAAQDVREVVQTKAALTPSIFAYAAQRDAAPFSVALASDGRLTIQRFGTTVLELTNTERKALVDAALFGVMP